MQQNTTLNLPDGLVSRAEADAAFSENAITDNPLLAFSQGRISRTDAIRMLGLRDYAGLLVALGDADLPLASAPPDEIEKQATTFAELWAQP